MEPIDDGLKAGAGILSPQERAALAEAERWLGDAVSGVAVSQTEDGHPCILVLAAPGALVPDRAAGLPVRVQATGPIRAREQRTGPAPSDTADR